MKIRCVDSSLLAFRMRKKAPRPSRRIVRMTWWRLSGAPTAISAASPSTGWWSRARSTAWPRSSTFSRAATRSPLRYLTPRPKWCGRAVSTRRRRPRTRALNATRMPWARTRRRAGRLCTWRAGVAIPCPSVLLVCPFDDEFGIRGREKIFRYRNWWLRKKIVQFLCSIVECLYPLKINQSINQLTNQSIKHSNNQSIKHWDNEPINQLIQSMHGFKLIESVTFFLFKFTPFIQVFTAMRGFQSKIAYHILQSTSKSTWSRKKIWKKLIRISKVSNASTLRQPKKSEDFESFQFFSRNKLPHDTADVLINNKKISEITTWLFSNFKLFRIIFVF